MTCPQSSVGRSTLSMTKTSTGPRVDSSLRPSCSCSAVKEVKSLLEERPKHPGNVCRLRALRYGGNDVEPLVFDPRWSTNQARRFEADIERAENQELQRSVYSRVTASLAPRRHPVLARTVGLHGDGLK